MSTPQEFQRVSAELTQLRARLEALADDLSQYNPGFGDYPRAAHLLNCILEES